MRKLVFVAIATMITATSLNAQSIQFGAKAGVNLASLSGDRQNVSDITTRTSFHLGGVAEIMLSDKFSFQPELLYSAQGAAYENADAGIEGTLKMDYLNVPLLGKYYITEGISIQAGPQVGLLLSAKNDFEDAGGDMQEEDIKDSMSGIDFGVNFGLGYKLPSGLFFDARYNLGLSNVNNDGDENNKNGAIQLSVGFSF